MFFFSVLFKKFLSIYFYTSILHYAVVSGETEFVKYLFTFKEFDIKEKFVYNILIFTIYERLLSYAFHSGNLELVKYLLSLNIFDINWKDI